MSPFNKFRIWPTPIPAGACHGTWHVPREGVGDTLPPVTLRRLDRLRSNLVCVYRPAGYYFCTSQMWGASARAHVHTPFQYLANGWTECSQIWCVTRDLLDQSFTHVRNGMQLHVGMCTPLFHSSQTARRILLEFDAWLETHSMSLTEVRCGAHMHVSTCTLLPHDGASAVARSSQITAPYSTNRTGPDTLISQKRQGQFDLDHFYLTLNYFWFFFLEQSYVEWY